MLAIGGCAGADDTLSVAAEIKTDAVQRREYPAEAQVTLNTGDCPVELVAVPSDDHEAITFMFSETLLSIDRRAIHCHVGIDYKFPAGWRFWRPAAYARGYELLSENEQRLALAVQTRLASGIPVSEFRLSQGPVDEDLQIDLDDGEVGGEAPTECGATSAHIDVDLLGSLFVSGPAIATVDTIDTAIDWAPCE